MADRNAAVDSWSDTAGGKVASFDNSNKTENSTNHGKDRDGQNVLFFSTGVQWPKTPKAGVDNDNIWTASSDPDSDGQDVSGYNCPLTKQDSYLAP